MNKKKSPLYYSYNYPIAMRFHLFILSAIAVLFATATQAYAQEELSFGNALEMMREKSRHIEIAQKGVEIATAQKQRLNSTWYPHIGAAGAYMNLSEEVRVEENIADIAQPLAQAIPQLESIISLLGPSSISFPLLDKDVATIDGTIVWPLFTGGKRIFANRIGKSLINSASLQREMTLDLQTVRLVERYYAVKLTAQNIDANQKAAQANGALYKNALKLMENGVINKAQMLVAKMAYEESALNLQSSIRGHKTAMNALLSIIGMDTISVSDSCTTLPITLSSPFFICNDMPDAEHFVAMALENNHQTKIMEQQILMAKENKKIAKSGYLPDISLFARQNIWSANIPSNLLPRRMVGAAFVWNIFDGLDRENNIRTASLQQQSLTLAKEEASSEIAIAVRDLYSSMEDAKESLKTIETAISLASELVKIREKSFREGMATAQEVVEANALLAKGRTGAALACYQYELALVNMIALCGNTGLFASMMALPGNTLR